MKVVNNLLMTFLLMWAVGSQADVLNAKLDCLAQNGGMNKQGFKTCAHLFQNKNTGENTGTHHRITTAISVADAINPVKNASVAVIASAKTGMKVIHELGVHPFGYANDKKQLKVIQSFGIAPKQAQEILIAKRSANGQVVQVPCGSTITNGMVFTGGNKVQGSMLLACHADAQHPQGNSHAVEMAMKYTAKDGTSLYQFGKCRNWFGGFVPPQVPETKLPLQTETPKRTFHISMHKAENERRALIEVNVGAWGGAYFGDKYQGQFYGGQGWVYMPIDQVLGTEEQISAGVGVYGAQDSGRSEVSAYHHDRSRVLGMLGIKGNGMNKEQNPHWWSINVGAGPTWLQGANSESGYWFKQTKYVGRLYAEYLTQDMENNMLYSVFGEGFLDMGGGSKSSSWSGFPGEGESSARVGIAVEKRFHKNFSVKGVAAMTFGQSDGVTSRFGAELGIYGCYRNSWDADYGFAIGCIGGGVNIGQGVIPYVGANVFAGQVFTKWVEHERASGVSYAPKQIVSRIPGNTTNVQTVIPPNNGGRNEDGIRH